MNVIVFWEEDFPFIDTAPLSAEALRSAGARGSVQFMGLDGIADALCAHPDLLVTPYGSAFPKDAWAALVGYLRAGGNWVNLGGAPLTRPVRRARAATPTGAQPAIRWHTEPPQTAYLKAIQLNHAFPIEVPADASLACPPPDAALETHFHRFGPRRVWALQPRFTTTRDFPHELGSSGPREATLRALVLAASEGRALAAPAVAIDWVAGQFAGGRWVLAPCEGQIAMPADLVRKLCEYAARSRANILVRPSFACYYPGEMAVLTVQVHPSFAGDLRINVRVYARDSQKEVYAHAFKARAGVSPAIVHTSPFPASEPGLYIVRASVEANGHSKPVAAAETGFWVHDRDLMASGKPVVAQQADPEPPGRRGAGATQTAPSAGTREPTEQTHGDLFSRGGRPYPVTGTTYMAGDVHRKFLFEPNPAIWDLDMAAIRESGANMLRTGLWTGWRSAMLDPGTVDEGVLRAFAAYLLTARRHDLPVIFTFFSFLPEAWGGLNPYLDPQAVAAQVTFVSAFARRFASANALWWDLINEPSFCSPSQAWRCRPNYGRHERKAWARWLAAQGLSDEEWRERWQLTPDEPLDLPKPEDFGDGHVRQGTRPLRALDYRRFAQEMFAAWADRLRAAIRENGSANQLVTVGQDEGGAGERPNPWFHCDAVDFTSNHSWWHDEHLLWDSIVAKTPGKPCLIEETGVMFGETPQGTPLRSPEEARNLLERKMALSFAAGCAGFVQWQWNTNVCIDSDVEAGIGLVRADGTEKPEMDAFRGVSAFFAENAHRMTGRRLEDVVVVLPHSLMLGPRDLATDATRRAVRTLEYDLGLPCRAVGEYDAGCIAGARLIVAPCARVLTEACWQALMDAARAGATVLATGFLEADEYWRPVGRLAEFGLATTAVNVQASEALQLPDGAWVHLAFGGGACSRVEKAAAVGEAGPARCSEHPLGAGRLVYCPVPVELAEGAHGARQVYEAAAQLAGLRIRPLGHSPGLLARAVEFADDTLLALVNESATDLPCAAADAHTPYGLRVPVGRIALAFVNRASGTIVSKYEVA